ncbi:MAG: hypothetical protein AAGF99_15110 [Bacteroidota bacterium]
MGQQQLLLLVLGIVIVGLAVVVGIDAFERESRKLEVDLLYQEAVNIAGDIVAWKKKPAAMGGGDESVSINEFRFAQAGYEETNEEGGEANTDRMWRKVYVSPASRPSLLLRSKRHEDIRVRLYLYGPDTACFVGQVSYRQPDNSWSYTEAPEEPAACEVDW